MIELAIRQYGVSLLNQWDEKDESRVSKNSGFMLQVRGYVFNVMYCTIDVLVKSGVIDGTA